jgi:hypothetical protein
MSTITAILDPAPDGTLHVPVPEAWRNFPIRIKAELEPANPKDTSPTSGNLKGFGCLRGQISLGSGFDEPLEDFKEYVE